MKVLQHERDAKDKEKREKARAYEVESLNRELEKGSYTYDYYGNIIFAQSANGDLLPPDFKFKYRFKRGATRLAGIGFDPEEEAKKALMTPA